MTVPGVPPKPDLKGLMSDLITCEAHVDVLERDNKRKHELLEEREAQIRALASEIQNLERRLAKAIEKLEMAGLTRGIL